VEVAVVTAAAVAAAIKLKVPEYRRASVI